MDSIQGINSLGEQLLLAVSNGDKEASSRLLQKGVAETVDSEGRTALHYAAANGNMAILKLLLTHGWNVNQANNFGVTCLQLASAEGHVEVVNTLLNHGAEVDHQDFMNGNTALHEASWKGYSITVNVLCKRKANVYIRNKAGFAGLHLCCQNGHNQTCRNLLLNGCKTELKNCYGDTPLHTACRYGHAGVVRILISAGSNPSHQNKNGDTPLHIASAMGRRKLVKILLQAKCDKTLKNQVRTRTEKKYFFSLKQGETATNIAERKNFTQVRDIIDQLECLEITKKKAAKISDRSDYSRNFKKKKMKKNSNNYALVSPYGCHNYPDLSTFPVPNLDSLPKDPLKKGEQYYLDLAGNIKKGPIGLGHSCYCAPLYHKFESNKDELLGRIGHAEEKLSKRIESLERHTRQGIQGLKDTFKERFAAERTQCAERTDKLVTQQSNQTRIHTAEELKALREEMKSWIAHHLHSSSISSMGSGSVRSEDSALPRHHSRKKSGTKVWKKTRTFSEDGTPTFSADAEKCGNLTISNFPLKTEFCKQIDDHNSQNEYLLVAEGSSDNHTASLNNNHRFNNDKASIEKDFFETKSMSSLVDSKLNNEKTLLAPSPSCNKPITSLFNIDKTDPNDSGYLTRSSNCSKCVTDKEYHNQCSSHNQFASVIPVHDTYDNLQQTSERQLQSKCSTGYIYDGYYPRYYDKTWYSPPSYPAPTVMKTHSSLV